jgi:hypothetical protein
MSIFHRRAPRIALVVTAALLGVLGTATSASASGTFTLHNVATGRCLDSNTSGSAYMLPCNGGDYQSWYYLGSDWSGAILLVDVHTGRCIAPTGATSIGTTGCNSNDAYDSWRPVSVNGHTRYENVVYDSDALDANNTSVYYGAVNGGNYQLWNLK